MPLVIEAELLRGTYDAGSLDEREGDEWPPHPARLVSALVAIAAESDRWLDAVRWLEHLEPPAIRASADRFGSTVRESYVPLNAIDKSGSYGRFPARKAGSLQTWRHISPRHPTVRFEWSAEPQSDILAALTEVVAEVPYLGRSSCPVQLRVVDQAVGELAGDEGRWTDVFVPGGMTDSCVVSLPRPGYVDDLLVAYRDGRSAHEVVRRLLQYGRETAEVCPPVHLSPFDPDFIVLPFADNKRVGGGYTMLLTQAIRKALESQLDGGPLVLRGGRPGQERPRHQVLILGLPDVGHRYASGMIAGVAVVLPREIAQADRSAVFRGIAAIEEGEVRAGRLGVVRFEQTLSSLRALDPRRWTRPSSAWTTATPVTADRFVDLGDADSVAELFRKACADVDLPTPVRVIVQRRPMLPGAQQVPARFRRRRSGGSALPSVHARIDFDGEVEGPVVLGNLRRYGLGLFLPEASA